MANLAFPNLTPLQTPAPAVPSLASQWQPGVVEQPVTDAGLLGDISKDPSKLLALLQFAGSVVQPVGPGQTQAGVIGKALTDAAGTFSKSRASEQADQQATAKLTEQKRQDVETSATEQSKIDLEAAMADYYKRLPASSKTSESKYDIMRDKEFVKKYAKDAGITEDQATVAIFRLIEAKTDPTVAALNLQQSVAENVTFQPEDMPEAVQGLLDFNKNANLNKEVWDQYVAGTDEQVLAAASDPQVKQYFVDQFGGGVNGELLFNQRYIKALQNQANKATQPTK